MIFIKRSFHRAVGADAFARTGHPLIQHLRLHDLPREDIGTRLRSDFELVFESRRNDEHGPVALALQ